MNRLTQAVRGGFIALLDRHLPERTKRLIFLASFSARLKDSTSLNNETLNKLNKVMVLCSTESAMKLPVQLSKAIWHGKNTFEICDDPLCAPTLSHERLQRISARVISSMPQWLRYADDKRIQQDVTTLLDNKRMVLGI